MKKITFLIIAVFLQMICLQSAAQSKLGLGFKAGLNLSTQSTTGAGEGVNVKSISRINCGAYCNYFLFDKLAIQPELILSGKGSDWNDPAYDVKDLLTYIDIPLLIRYQPLKYVNIHAGPQVGFLISALQKDNISGEKTNIQSYYNGMDFSFVAGAEANLPFNLNLTMRYILGITSGSNDIEYVEPWMNRVFQVSLGYRIIGK